MRRRLREQYLAELDLNMAQIEDLDGDEGSYGTAQSGTDQTNLYQVDKCT